MSIAVQGNLINGAIIIFGVGIWLYLMYIHTKMKAIKKKTTKIYRETKSESVINTASGEYGYDIKRRLDIEAMDKVREEFNGFNAGYNSAVQLISILPLAGLLGTIMGLIPGLEAARSAEFTTLSDSLSTALYSTLFGIVASIVLKIYVAIRPAITISNIVDDLDENDRKLDYALGFKKISDEEKA